jgi:hypothetical protein
MLHLIPPCLCWCVKITANGHSAGCSTYWFRITDVPHSGLVLCVVTNRVALNILLCSRVGHNTATTEGPGPAEQLQLSR